jgi:putative phosphoesterase
MKIAILSDIHGNIFALKAVLKQMKRLKIDLVFVLGDQMGYYKNVVEVYNELDKWNHYIISGNHERIFSKYLLVDKAFNDLIDTKYGTCYSYYKKSFNPDLINRIKSLKDEMSVTIDGYKFLLCHGSPIEKDHYIYPDTDKVVLKDCLDAALDHDIIFNGHTHYPMVFSKNNKKLINVGSVGQSRTTGGIANWGIFNTKNGIFAPQNTPYCISELKNTLKDESNKYLTDILSRNNEINES